VFGGFILTILNLCHMLIEEIVGQKKELDLGNRKIETLPIEWFELSKRIQRKKTDAGTDVAIRFLKQGQRLSQDDVVYMDSNTAIVVDVLPCDAIQVTPKSMFDMGVVCYEIGNKHLPIFIQDDLVLMPFEEPIFKWLQAKGFQTEKVNTKLTNLINSTVQPHGHALDEKGGGSIFSKIMSIANAR
jgi:urease accessory protein